MDTLSEQDALSLHCSLFYYYLTSLGLFSNGFSMDIPFASAVSCRVLAHVSGPAPANIDLW